MKIPAPSSKVIAILIIVTILTTVTIVSSKFFGGSENFSKRNLDLTIKNNLAGQIDLTDTDGDGLQDWQEEIWGADKNNSDTDGDGTPDGEEVGNGRNPLTPGPDDKILDDKEIAAQVIQESLARETDPNSATSILSKNLLIRLAQLEQSGQYTTETGDALAKEIADQTLELVKIPEKYPENLFLTFDSKDLEKLEIYAEQINDIEISEYLKVDKNKKDNIDQFIDIFKNIASRFSVIPVPKDLVSVHAKITNGYYIAAEALINLKNSDSDPLLGILSMPIYIKISEEQPILYQQIKTYLESSGIIFKTESDE